MNFVHQLATTRTKSDLHAGGAIVVAAMLVLVAVVAVPVWSNHTRRMQLHAAVDAAEVRLQRTRLQIDETKRELIASSAQLATIEAGPNASRTLDRRLLDISSMAAEFGLLVDSVDPGSTAKRSDGDVVTAIATSGRGLYPQVIAFIHRLREAAPDLDIETAQLTSTPDRGCAFRLSLGWHSPPSPTAAPAARPTAVAGGES